MRHLTGKDAVATILVAAIAVPYIGYLINGSMPFVQDPTGMAGVGLLLGLAAALVGGWIALREGTVTTITTVALGIVSLGAGIAALVSEHLFDPTAREIVLGGFMATIAVMWGIALLRHSGILSEETHPTSRLGHI
jgi:hypothetical protein